MSLGEVLAGVHENDQCRLGCLQFLGGFSLYLRLCLSQSEGLGLGRSRFQGQASRGPGGSSSLHHVYLLKAKLPIPGGDQGASDFVIAGENHRAVFYHQHIVGALDHLASGEPLEAWDMALLILLAGANIYQVGGFPVQLTYHGLKSGYVQVADAVFLGAFVGVGFSGGQTFGRRLRQVQPVGAELQVISGQQPSRGPVLQPVDVGQPHALQYPGADDAAGASGAVDDNGGVWVQVFGDVGNSQRQFPARDAASAGDAETLVLLGSSGV